MAEQDVMYKYISKNIIFVVTASPKASHEIGSATPEEASLVVYLIDTITGCILYRMTHQGCQAPVHTVRFPTSILIFMTGKKELKFLIFVAIIADFSLCITLSVYLL